MTCAEEMAGSDELASWEGSNGWIRQQFELYLASLLCTVSSQEVTPSPEAATADPEKATVGTTDFFDPWVSAWRRTQNYALWKASVDTAKIASDFTAGHPFHVSGSFVELRSGISRRVEELNTLTAPLQTELSKAVVEGGKVLNTYVERLSEKTAGATTSLSTTVNSWWKLGSQYVAATVEKARETLVEEGRPGIRDQPPLNNQ